MPSPSSAQLHVHERSVTSQNGEDGILAALIDAVGTTNRTAVEFGAGVGPVENNTLRLVDEAGWTVVWLDGADQPSDSRVRQAFITADNINALFVEHGVPDHPDVLSIDIDSNDYWVLDAIDERFAPRILVVEYNASLGPIEQLTIAYDPTFVWQVNDYFGASLAALAAAADRKGLALVGCDSLGINAFFVARDALTDFVELTPEQAFVPCGYGIVEDGRHVGYRRADRSFERV